MSVDHPGIIKLFSIIPEDQGIHLVLEYGGLDLAYQYDVLKISMSELQIKIIMRELLQTLSYLHQNLIIHRDLKLSNILFALHSSPYLD